jgi:hypothetical protein
MVRQACYAAVAMLARLRGVLPGALYPGPDRCIAIPLAAVILDQGSSRTQFPPQPVLARCLFRDHRHAPSHRV